MTGQNVILLRYGELHLKGRNRPYFIKKLREGIRVALKGSTAKLEQGEGRYYVTDYAAEEEDLIVTRLKRVFGLHSISRARRCSKDWDVVTAAAQELLTKERDQRNGFCTFKVESRRSDKNYPMNSMEMNRELGGILLETVDDVKVDVKKPDVLLRVEIREDAYVYGGEEMAAGGLPPGCNGRVSLLLSGGIDSPVAGHMMMKRGLKVDAIYFHSPPYTSERAKEKVVSLAQTLARYSGYVNLHVVPFTEMQLAIYEKCPASQCTIILRRAMMQIAERITQKLEGGALVTGESLGQVASQTLEGLHCTNDAVELPVFRPLIGFDKSEIVERARAIDSYDISILPYEDCCTIFTPRNPVIHPKLDVIRKSQSLVENWDELIEKAVENTEWIDAKPRPE